MGLLVNGQWHDQWYDTKKSKGEFIREGAQFRHWITPDGVAGPTGEGGFVAEADRYHLYVSLACPWAHRTLIFRELKQLQKLISVSVVHPDMLDKGWTFQQDSVESGMSQSNTLPATGDTLYGYDYVHQIYTRDNPEYSGRVTVPILWDKKQQRIVNNESSEIIRMFNSAFNHLTNNHDDYYPEAHRKEIDSINHVIYHTVNNGVYKAGFATTPEAYEKAFTALFDTLDMIEQRLSSQTYLVGDTITEADWRLFTTLVRFDSVYVGHFKCNKKRIVDYPNLWTYVRRLYHYPEVKSAQVKSTQVKDTVNMVHIKRHYYYSHETINPTRIVPVGPEIDWRLPDDREQLCNNINTKTQASAA